MRRIALLPLLSLVTMPTPGFAQDAPVPVTGAEEDDADDVTVHGNEILVIATRIRGQVDAPQPPILTLDEADIASYGAGSLNELLAALSPQTGSGRGRGDGRPVILLNGQRISSFREMRDIPPEAIRRMEILPEEVALRYGYPANQRVVNLILKDNFSSKTIAGEYHVPTLGGFAEGELEAGTLRINGPSRINLSAKVEKTTPLTEAERGVIQTESNRPTVAGDADPAASRYLIDSSRDITVNGTWAMGLGPGPAAGSLTVNGTFTRSDSRSLFGLDTVRLTAPDGATAIRSIDDPLARTSRSNTAQAGITLNKPVAGWQLTATVDASYGDTVTLVDRQADTRGLVTAALAGTLPIAGVLPALLPAGRDRAQTKDLGLTSLVTFAGTPFRMPAGEASLTVKAGYAYNRSDNRDARSTGGRTVLDRGDFSAGVNLALPLTSRRDDVLAGIGDLSANFSAGLNHLSDFGTVKDWSAGLNWSPTEKLGLQATYIVDEAAPSLAQLGNPQILAFNSAIYDFSRGETVLATIINGGNPNLKRETQRDLKFGANWQLPFLKNSNVIVEYFRNRSSDVTQSFPLLTPEIESAFPGRVVRDAGGRIVSIDRRPVTFDEVSSSRIRYGFNLSGTIGKAQPGGDGMMGGMRRPGGPGGPGGGGMRGPGGGFGGPGGFGRGPGGNGQGRWSLSVYHTVRFSEQVVIAAGGPTLDLLGGDAIAAGGVARHSLEMEGGGFYKGFGLRLNGSWSAPVTVRASGGPGTSDLRFGSVFNLNGRLFVNFDQKKKLVESIPFLKGARLSLEVDNLFNVRQRVTDGNGLVPIGYQADYRDPRGRVIGLDFRKMF